MTKQQEEIIIKDIVAGDAQAFALLVNAYKDMAVLLAYNIVLNEEDAEELAQDAFVKAYQSLSTFRANARFATWFYRIVVNKALNKRKLKKYYWDEISDALTEELPYSDKDSFAFHITSEHRKYIQAALQTIHAKERLCITLFYLNELSIAEIHELTNITTANIKVLLYRGRKNLYTALHRELKQEVANLIKS